MALEKIKASFSEAVLPIKDGSVIMIGGFMLCGTPEKLVNAVAEKGIKNLTIISNDAGYPGRGVGKLLANGQIKTLITTHVGLNPDVAKYLNDPILKDSFECILVPMGTLAERVRAGGSGLGGILTPTGIGTLIAEGKEVINIEGKDYLLEKALRADFALIRASKIDKFGNTIYYGTSKNFNPLIATAADHVIAGACEIVETGSLDPDFIHTSGIFIDAIVTGEE